MNSQVLQTIEFKDHPEILFVVESKTINDILHYTLILYYIKALLMTNNTCMYGFILHFLCIYTAFHKMLENITIYSISKPDQRLSMRFLCFYPSSVRHDRIIFFQICSIAMTNFLSVKPKYSDDLFS